MKDPHISLAFSGGRLVAHGHGEHEEQDWERAGLVKRGRLAADQEAADKLRGVYRILFHRRFLVYPRVLAYITVGAPSAEYLLWDAVLRASGAWDWELRGLETFLCPSGEGYTAVVHLGEGFTGVALLKNGNRCAADLMQGGLGDVPDTLAAETAGRTLLDLLSAYSQDVNPDEAGLLAAVEVRAFCGMSSQVLQKGLAQGLGGFQTGGTEIFPEEELHRMVAKAVGKGAGSPRKP